MQSLQLFSRDLQLAELVLQPALVVLDVAEPEPLVGQLGLGLAADLAELLGAPLDDLTLGRRILGRRLLGRLGFGLPHRLVLTMARKGMQQHQQGTQGADHGVQKREHLDG